MVRCDFCHKEFEKNKGIVFVKIDGTAFNFCSRKCRKSFHMGRNPIKTEWTEKHKAKKKQKAKKS